MTGTTSNDRLTSITGGGQIKTFSYEPGSDHLMTGSADSVTTTFQYDTAGRRRTRTDVIDGKTFQTTYRYDDVAGAPVVRNIGVEASKGFLIGATLGLAAPALADTTAEVGLLTTAGGHTRRPPSGQSPEVS